MSTVFRGIRHSDNVLPSKYKKEKDLLIEFYRSEQRTVYRANRFLGGDHEEHFVLDDIEHRSLTNILITIAMNEFPPLPLPLPPLPSLSVRVISFLG